MLKVLKVMFLSLTMILFRPRAFFILARYSTLEPLLAEMGFANLGAYPSLQNVFLAQYIKSSKVYRSKHAVATHMVIELLRYGEREFLEDEAWRAGQQLLRVGDAINNWYEAGDLDFQQHHESLRLILEFVEDLSHELKKGA